MSQPDRLAQLKQVYLTVEKLQQKLEAMQQAQTEPIAILGLGCRYPNGANSPAAFWQLLRDGRDGITAVPADRWEADAFYDPAPDRPGKIATRWGGFLDNVAGFDARFFGIAPREAAQMDPQQRLLLEVAWEALEAAGQPPGGLAGTATGVYVGLLNSEYGWLQFRDLAGLDAYSGTGTSHSVASGRLSYVLGLNGPSVTLDTACSSSLVAVHLACQALRQKECDLALAGGVSLILSPLALMPFSRMGLLAGDGRCKTLDARADGFGSGEGCALVVLKRLSDAQAAGDPILAVIRGSAVNQDGRTNVLSAPNGRSQEAVIRKALENAGVRPADLSLIELHGTGTALGDPIETDALRAIYSGQGGDASQPIYLGAVKSNIGHTGAAAGLAGLIKAVLALQHEEVPPNLHFGELNPHINLSGTTFAIPTLPMPWPRGAAPRLAGISAFGWSGTNAHLVLSDPPQPVSLGHSDDAPAHLLAISARSEAALRDLAAAYRDHLRSPAGQAQPLPDLAYTAAVRRSHHAYRLAALGHDHALIADRLDAYLSQTEPAGVIAGLHHGTRRRKLVFVFSPHGAQWLGMGRALWDAVPAFREALEACEAALRAYVSWSLKDKLWSEDARWLEEIDVLQPSLFALQVAVAAAWRAWGVEPDAIVGHSMGEVAAAHVAGVLSLDDAARIICRRTQLLRGVRGDGAMGVVELSFAQAEAAIAPFAGRLSIAASNSPRSTILAGEPAALEALFDQLQAREVFCGWGVADVASHSPRMAGLSAELRQAIGAVDRRPARVPLYSTVSGIRDDGRQFEAEYWVRHLNQPVLFASAVRALAETGHDLFLEIGPGPVLGPAIDEGLQALEASGAVLASLRRGEGDYATLLEGLGRLYALGYPVAWPRLYPSGSVVDLPAYPWQRERFWLPFDPASLAESGPRGRDGAASGLLGARREVAGEPGKAIWEQVYDRRFFPHLFQHRLLGRPVLPASAYLELAFGAAVDGPASVCDLTLTSALRLSEEAPWTEGQVIVEREADGSAALRFFSRTVAGWQPHAAGRVAPVAAGLAPALRPVEQAQASLPEQLEGAAVYAGFQALGVEYGPELQAVSALWWGRDEALARVHVPERFRRELAAGALPTAAVDPALQAFAWLVARHPSAANELYAPAAIARVTLHQPGIVPAWSHARLDAIDGMAITGAAELLDEGGAPVLTLEGIRFAVVTAQDSGNLADWVYEVAWEPVDTPAETTSLTGRWLIVADQSGVGSALAESIEQGGGHPIVVASQPGVIGAEYLDSLSAPDLRGLIDVRCVDPLPADAHLSDERRLTHYSAQVLRLVQALKQAAPEATVPLWLVTVSAQPMGRTAVRPEQAAVWGLGYVMAEEHHELWGGLIDLDPAVPSSDSARQIVRHLAAADGEDRVAFRADQRLAARLRPHTLIPAPSRSTTRFRPDGAYLITGGLGEIALEVARWTVEHGARRLILLGRSELPPRAQWRSLAAGSPLARRVKAVRALEAQGAAIHLVTVDVGDAAALAACLDDYAAEGWPAIQGVIHCAAVIEDRLLAALDAESLQRVARPKAAGAWHLHEYFASQPLDFFVLFSSSGSLMGAAGQANYAAANAALDGIAHARRAAGQPAVSMNWGFWDGLGFANTPGGRRAVAYMAAAGLTPFKAEEALQALGYVLAQPELAQLAAMKIDWSRWRAHSRLVGVPPFLRHMDRANGDAAPLEPPADLVAALKALEPGPQRLRRLETFLREQLAGVLRLDPSVIDADTPLGSLGIDSLTAIELRNRLERGLGLQLSATLVWNYPSLAALAPYLADKLGLAVVPERGEAPAASSALDADLAGFLSEAEALSDDELRRLLEGMADQA